MLDSRKPTDFEMSVYHFIQQIPRGKVLSYSDIVAGLGRGSSRSVGSALAKNPFAPEVPCHRVVCKNGSLGGFYGKTEGPQLTKKRDMLEQEGVQFDDAGRVICNQFYTPIL